MKSRAVALAALMVLSIIAGSVALSGTAAAGPPGFVTTGSGVSDQTVNPANPPQGKLPEQAQGTSGQTGPPEHALEKMPDHARQNVMASRGSMDVQWAPTENGKTALVVTDDQTSDAGEVAIPIEAFEETRGEVPPLAYGVHESGERWTAAVTVSDGYAVFEIPHFSTNTIVWSGQFTLEAHPATDGFSYTYQQEDPVSSWDVNLTGIETTETETVSAANINSGGTVDASIAGNLDPPETTLTFEGNQYTGSRYTPGGTGTVTSMGINGDTDPSGPNNGEPEITFTGNGDTNARTVSSSGDSNGATTSYTVGGNLPAENEQVTFTGTSTDVGRATNSLGTYSDGGSDSFGISDLDEAANPAIDLTGVLNTEEDSISATQVSDGGTVDANIAGNVDVEDSLDISFGGNGYTKSDTESWTSVDDGSVFGIGYSDDNLEPLGPSNNGQPQSTITVPGSGYTNVGKDTAEVGESGDVDGDGTDELVYLDTFDVIRYYDVGDGTEVDTGQESYGGGLSVGDVDGDGTDEIVYLDTGDNIDYYDAVDGTNSDTGQDSYGGLSAGDVDGDGIDEIVYADAGDRLDYYDVGDGTSTHTGEDSYVGPSVGDVDDDGAGEIIYADEYDNLDYYDVGDGTSTDTEQDAYGGLSAGDVDDDGADEIIYADASADLGYYDAVDGTSTDTGAGAIETSTGDVDGDGIDEIVYREGYDTGDHLDYYDVVDGTSTYTGQRPMGEVSAGDVDDDGADELVYRDPGDEIHYYDVGLPADVGFDLGDDGSTEHSKTVDPGNSLTVELSDLVAGDDSVQITTTNPSIDIEFEAQFRKGTQDPAIDIDGDGSNEGSHSGILQSGETATVTVDPTIDDDSWTVSTAAGTADVSATVTEGTQTNDVDVVLNGKTYSYSGSLAGGSSASLTPSASDLQEGTNTVDVSLPSLSADAPPMEVGIDSVSYDDLQYTEDPSIDVDGDGTNEASYSGELPTGQTSTSSVSLTPGSYTESTSLTTGTVDWSMDFTEVTGTENPAVDVDGDGVEEASYSGALNSGQTSTKQLSGLQAGTHDIETVVDSGPDPDWQITYDEELYTDSPAVDIDGDGTDEATHTGKLGPGETASSTIDPSLGDDSWSVSTGGPVDVSAEVTERTVTEDVTLSVNGNTATHTGTLGDGSTTSLSVDPAWINDSGENVVDVEVAPSLSADAPEPSVDLYYTHEGEDNDMVAFEAEKWSERYNISKTFAENQTDATVTIPFDGAVLSVRNLEYRVNGDTWADLPDSDYEFTNTTITAHFGAVTAGDTIEVRTTGSKINVYDGEVQVTEPTPEGEKLNTQFEVLSKGENFGIEVTNTLDENRLWHLETASWQDAEPYALVDSTGEQTLKTPNANIGSTGRVDTLPMWVNPENDVGVQVLDADVPRFQLRPGATEGDTVAIEYQDTVSGQAYALQKPEADDPTAVDTAESPVYFKTVDTLATYEIIETTLDDGGAAMAAPLQTEQSDTLPITLLIGVVGALGGLLLIARGLGGSGRTRSGSDVSVSIPVIGRSFSLPSLPSLPSTGGRTTDKTTQLVVVGGMVIVGIVALEFATVQPLLEVLVSALAMGSETLTELGTIFVGIGALLGLWYLDQRTTESIPRWLTGVAAVVTVTYIIETIQPGVLLGPASSGFETISPLFWLVLIGGGAYLVYGYIKSRNTPDTRVTLQLRGKDK